MYNFIEFTEFYIAFLQYSINNRLYSDNNNLNTNSEYKIHINNIKNI